MNKELKNSYCQFERSREPSYKIITRTSTPLGLTYVKYLFFTFLILSFISCQQKIDVKIPNYVQKLVVEGRIETGTYPQVYLTYSVPYFGNHTTNLSDFVVKGAFVTVSDGFTVDTLRDATFGNGFLYKAQNMIGVEGRTYHLMISVNGKTYTAQTSIYPLVKLDTLWFKPEKQDSLGFIYTHMHEPPQLGNWYRWEAKRMKKDSGFIAPLGSSFDDKFINGKSFDFAYDRGILQNSTATDDNNAERGYFKKGDRVVVKFSSIGENEFLFFRSYDANIISNGNPFAAPSNLQSNITGQNVLGVWCGYNPYIDTVLLK